MVLSLQVGNVYYVYNIPIYRVLSSLLHCTPKIVVAENWKSMVSEWGIHLSCCIQWDCFFLFQFWSWFSSSEYSEVLHLWLYCGKQKVRYCIFLYSLVQYIWQSLSGYMYHKWFISLDTLLVWTPIIIGANNFQMWHINL